MVLIFRENESCALKLDDALCIAIIKAIKNFTDIADPMTTDSAELEPSTPDDGVEPVSVVSHLAEQEQSISDDSGHSVTSPMLEGTDITKVTPSIENTDLYVNDDPSEMVVIGADRRVYLTEAHAETVSVDTANDVDEDVYLEG